MTYKDMIKKSFLEGFSADVSAMDIIITLGVVAAIGIFIFCVYRITTRKAFYSKSFGVSLVALALITAGIILTIQSSIVLSLGMVGALSIVRFRTAVKDPMDLVFLFWAISIGIVCGAGLFEVAIVVSVMVAISIVVLEMIPVVKSPYILVVNTSNSDTEEKLMAVVKTNTSYAKVKSRTITMKGLDMVIELRTKQDAVLVKAISELEDVVSVSLLNHDGEVTY